MWKHTAEPLRHGVWTWFVVTYDFTSGYARTYQNGIPRGTVAIKGGLAVNQTQMVIKLAPQTSTKIQVAAPGDPGPPNPFGAVVSCIQLWDSVLCHGDIVALYRSGVAAPTGHLVTPLCEWPLDEKDGHEFRDVMMQAPIGLVNEYCSWWLSPSILPAPSSLNAPVKEPFRRSWAELFDSEDCSDLIVSTSENSVTGIWAHRHVLFWQCPGLRRLKLLETERSGQDLLVIPELSEETLRLVVRWVYTDEVELTSSNVAQVIRTSMRYEVHDLTRICFKFLLANLSRESFYETLRLCAKPTAPDGTFSYCMEWAVSEYAGLARALNK